MRHLFARARKGGETNPRIIALTVMLATFVEVLDTSVANAALPHIAGNLSAGVDESTWGLALQPRGSSSPARSGGEVV